MAPTRIRGNGTLALALILWMRIYVRVCIDRIGIDSPLRLWFDRIDDCRQPIATLDIVVLGVVAIRGILLRQIGIQTIVTLPVFGPVSVHLRCVPAFGLTHAPENRLIGHDLAKRPFVHRISERFVLPESQEPEVHETIEKQFVQTVLHGAVKER